VSGPGVRAIWDAIYGLQGAKAALPGGALPGLPHINGAGQLVESGSATAGGKHAATTRKAGG
jgi:hypothetical protein